MDHPNTRGVQLHIAQSEAGTRGALAKFDGTVLNTLRETETALNAYSRELDRHALLQAARDQSAIAAGQVQTHYQSGRTGLLDALDAKRALATNEAGLAASSAELVDDQVILFLALGGGVAGSRRRRHRLADMPAAALVDAPFTRARRSVMRRSSQF